MTTDVRAPSVPIYLAGAFVEAGTPLEVRNPTDGSLVVFTTSATSGAVAGNALLLKVRTLKSLIARGSGRRAPGAMCHS